MAAAVAAAAVASNNEIIERIDIKEMKSKTPKETLNGGKGKNDCWRRSTEL